MLLIISVNNMVFVKLFPLMYGTIFSLKVSKSSIVKSLGKYLGKQYFKMLSQTAPNSPKGKLANLARPLSLFSLAKQMFHYFHIFILDTMLILLFTAPSLALHYIAIDMRIKIIIRALQDSSISSSFSPCPNLPNLFG